MSLLQMKESLLLIVLPILTNWRGDGLVHSDPVLASNTTQPSGTLFRSRGNLKVELIWRS